MFSGNNTTVVPVPTLPNNVFEGEETFTVAILVPVDTIRKYRVTRGSPETATIAIIDDDSE